MTAVSIMHQVAPQPASQAVAQRQPAWSPTRASGAGLAATPLIQRQVRLGSDSDPLEREADRAAATIGAGGSVVGLSAAGPAAQRQCAACAEHEKLAIRRKCAACEAEERALQRKGSGPAERGAVETAAQAVSSGGTPLSAQQRAYFEPRFGREFSAVRLHRDARAQRAAAAIGARAYTYGNAIAFAGGEPVGTSLLAHELAHVVQQSGGVLRRQPAIGPIDTSGGGNTSFVDTVVGTPTAGADGTFSGQVRRREIAPATGTQPQQTIHDETVGVIFDPRAGVVRLPFRMNFVAAATSGTAGICSTGAAGPVLNAGQLNAIAAEAVAESQAGLNGWFKLRVRGCKHALAGRDIPIRVEVSRSATNPDVTINVVNRSGRADAGTICAPNFNPGTTVHESGHQRLGVGDEYRERDPAVLAAVPIWGRNERVRDDFTRMGAHHTYGRLSAFHERHFQFAQVFVQAALGGGCRVELHRARALPIEARISVGASVFDTQAGPGWALNAGVDARLPLTTSRRFNLEAGLHGLYLRTPGKYRDALLFGARIGLSAQTHPGSEGPSVSLFAGLGSVVLPEREAFGELGGKLGFYSDMDHGRRWGLEVEGAMGRVLGDDPEQLNYARLGLNLVLSQ